jgi:alcohol dehydrogenase class IV
LGARYKTPHGKAVGIFLPLVVEFNRSVCPDRFDRLNRLFPDEVRAETLDASLRKLFRAMGQDSTVASLGVPHDEYFAALEEIASMAAESTGLVTNPRDAGSVELRELLTKAYGGER